MLPPTSLDPEGTEGLETKSHHASDRDYSTSRYQRQVFGSLMPDQHRLASLLHGAADAAIGQVDLQKYVSLGRLADKLLDCAKTPWIQYDPIKIEFHLHEFRCRSRLCTRCTITRSEILRQSMRPMVKEFNSPRLLTLTVRSSEDPLKDQLKHIVQSFAKLRRSKLWLKKFFGGIYTIEVTHNRKTDLWHPHIHAVIDGKYCKQSELANAWCVASGGSRIVDIRMAHDRGKALDYITKYVTKTNDVSKVPDHKVPEWAVAVRGMRFVSTFGSLRGKQLIDDEEYEPPDRDQLTHLTVLETEARCGDEKADQLWEAVVKEAHRGSLPDDPKLKTIAIDRRQTLYAQLKLWISDRSLPPPDDPTEDPPEKRDHLCKSVKSLDLFEHRPSHGSD